MPLLDLLPQPEHSVEPHRASGAIEEQRPGDAGDEDRGQDEAKLRDMAQLDQRDAAAVVRAFRASKSL